MIERIGNKRRATRLYLKEWREKFELTQEQLAERLETTKGRISKIENGKIRVHPILLDSLAQAFGIDDPLKLLRPPDAPSVDQLLAQATAEQRATAFRLVEAFLKSA
jgi:transcriptional regulator with XRE-family HTH domain